jgi:pyruvate/2-oxoglutarate dehydrogenase complex dihydrolipoamide dehydrogenase (E3) component
MPQPERYEILILGSGEGGKLLAWELARAGRRTAVVERRWIGGSCPNIACLPTKDEIWSAKVAHQVRHGAQFGAMTGPVVIDMPTVRRRKRAMVDAQIAAHLQNYKASGAELIMGSGRFVAPKTLEVCLNDGGTRVLTGEKVFLNIGTHATIPNVPGLEAARPLTHVEALELDYVPAHLIVLGGGYVGLELAQAHRRFGSRVTVIEHGPRLMGGREDPDVADEMQRILCDDGIDVVTSAETLRVHGRSGEDVGIIMRTAAGERNVAGSDILVASGRTPNTAGIGLAEAGVELDTRGYIRVNGRLETSAPDVWALGECAGSPQFTHVSHDDFRIIRDNLAGGQRSTRGRLVPYCMFTDPPLARVGLSETEAQRQGDARREAADERRAARKDDRGDTRLHEGSCRRERRSHSRFHHDRRRCGRGRVRGADDDACGVALSRARRGHSRAPDDGGGTGLLVLECAACVDAPGHPGQCVAGARGPVGPRRIECAASLSGRRGGSGHLLQQQARTPATRRSFGRTRSVAFRFAGRRHSADARRLTGFVPG